MLTQAEIEAINGFDTEGDYLEHWGILGMKWGIRRYQNPDGSLTAAGRARYNRLEAKKTKIMQSGNAKKILKYQKHLTDEEFDQAMSRAVKTEAYKASKEAEKKAAKAEKQAIKDAKEAKKEHNRQVKISEDAAKKANKVINDNSKQNVKSKSFMDYVTTAATIAGTVYTLYNNVNNIANLAGVKLPKFGKKKTTATPTPAAPATPIISTSEPKSTPTPSDTKPTPTPTPSKERPYKDTYVHKGYSKEAAYELSRSPLGSIKMDSIKPAEISAGKSILSELGSPLGSIKMESIKPTDVSAGKLILDDWFSGSKVGYDFTKREKVRMPSL